MYNIQGGGKCNDGISLESDEQALAHITAHAGNLPSAQFGAHIVFGGARSVTSSECLVLFVKLCFVLLKGI